MHTVTTGSTTNGELKLYVDGILLDTNSLLTNGITFNGAGSFGTLTLAVGGARTTVDAGQHQYDELLDEVAIYGTVLNAETVRDTL